PRPIPEKTAASVSRSGDRKTRVKTTTGATTKLNSAARLKSNGETMNARPRSNASSRTSNGPNSAASGKSNVSNRIKDGKLKNSAASPSSNDASRNETIRNN